MSIAKYKQHEIVARKNNLKLKGTIIFVHQYYSWPAEYDIIWDNNLNRIEEGIHQGDIAAWSEVPLEIQNILEKRRLTWHWWNPFTW